LLQFVLSFADTSFILLQQPRLSKSMVQQELDNVTGLMHHPVANLVPEDLKVGLESLERVLAKVSEDMAEDALRNSQVPKKQSIDDSLIGKLSDEKFLLQFKEAGTMPREYAALTTYLDEHGFYQPVNLSKFEPLDCSRQDRFRWLKNLSLPCDVAIFKYHVGGSCLSLTWVVKREPSQLDDDHALLIECQEMLRKPEVHSRAQKMQFKNKMSNTACITPALVDYIYTALTGDESHVAAVQKKTDLVDKHIASCISPMEVSMYAKSFPFLSDNQKSNLCCYCGSEEGKRTRENEDDVDAYHPICDQCKDKKMMLIPNKSRRKVQLDRGGVRNRSRDSMSSATPTTPTQNGEIGENPVAAMDNDEDASDVDSISVDSVSSYHTTDSEEEEGASAGGEADEKEDSDIGEEVSSDDQLDAGYCKRYTNKRAKLNTPSPDSNLEVGDWIEVGWPAETFIGKVIAVHEPKLHIIVGDSNSPSMFKNDKRCARTIRFTDGEKLNLGLDKHQEITNALSRLHFGQWRRCQRPSFGR